MYCPNQCQIRANTPLPSLFFLIIKKTKQKISALLRNFYSHKLGSIINTLPDKCERFEAGSTNLKKVGEGEHAVDGPVREHQYCMILTLYYRVVTKFIG